MKIYDISQEVLGCTVYPGDPVPTTEKLTDMNDGGLYNLSVLKMCMHNGTHTDAPSHFIKDGKNIDEISLDSFVGMCCVVQHSGEVLSSDAEIIIAKAKTADNDAWRRILIKGDAVVSAEAAEVFAKAGILLLGNESQSVGPMDAPMAVHKILLGRNVVLLEGICLAQVPEGVYLLSAAPLNISGAEGSPCRAVLIDMK